MWYTFVGSAVFFFVTAFVRSCYLRTQENERREKQWQKNTRRQKQLARIMEYPVCRITQAELEEIRLVEVTPHFLKECPLGTRFICRDTNDFHPQFDVMGQVVAGEDLLASQSAALCPPVRGINRYRVEVISE